MCLYFKPNMGSVRGSISNTALLLTYFPNQQNIQSQTCRDESISLSVISTGLEDLAEAGGQRGGKCFRLQPSPLGCHILSTTHPRLCLPNRHTSSGLMTHPGHEKRGKKFTHLFTHSFIYSLDRCLLSA